MTQSNQDMWSQWLLHRRHGGDLQQRQAIMQGLEEIRDRVLDHANIQEGETLLDVGCGDGLIAFGALGKVKDSRVIFSDISQDLLNESQSIAQEMHLLDRCQFLHASASDLSALNDSSVDVVTTRSVLIYVLTKRHAFEEFYRVLKPRGRLSIFEPINRFASPEPPHIFLGYDVTPVQEIVGKLKAVYLRIQPPETDTMLDFGERDLLTLIEKAGFQEIHLELQISIRPKRGNSWEALLRSAGNPRIPTLEEAMHEALTPDEQERLTAHLRALVETNQGVTRSALA